MRRAAPREAAAPYTAGWVLATLAIATGCGGAAAGPAEPGAPMRSEDFAYGMPVSTGAGPAASPAWRVAMPLEVYRALVRADRGDLRVFNARGEPVPHQVRRPEPPPAVSPPAEALPTFALRGDPATALRDVRVQIESGGAAISVQAPASASPATPESAVAAYIVDARGLRAPVAAFELRWAESVAQFAGRLEIEASDDLDRWRSVGSGSIANLAAGGARLVENRIQVPATASRYWRLSWAGAPAPFVIDSIGAVRAGRRADVARASTTAVGAADPGRPGDYVFDLGAPLPVDRVNVLLPEPNMVAQAALWSRDAPADAWSVVSPGLPLYRLTTAGREIRNAPHVIDPTPRRYWKLRALPRGSSLGSEAPRLEVGWPPHEVWFVARGPGPFLLAYGSAIALPSGTAIDSILEATRLGDGATRVAPALATLGPARVLGGEARRRPPTALFPWRAAALWAVLVGGVLALGTMAWRLLRETRGGGPGDPGTAT